MRAEGSPKLCFFSSIALGFSDTGVRTKTRKNMKIFKAILLLTILCSAHADVLPDVEATNTLASKVMSKIDKSDLDGASALLKKYWPLPPQEIDAAIYQMKQQQPLIKDRFGSPLSSEKTCTQSIGRSWRRVIYLQKFERHTLLWTFDFYKPQKSWVVNAFNFNDRWQSIFGNKCSNK